MFGTLTATSMVEFSGDGGVAGINMPVDATGPSKTSAYWLGNVGGPMPDFDTCHAKCAHLLGSGTGGGSSQPAKTTNADDGGNKVVGLGVGAIVTGAFLGGAAYYGVSVVVVGVTIGPGVMAYVGGVLVVGGLIVLAQYAASGRSFANIIDALAVSDLSRYQQCVLQCQTANKGPGGSEPIVANPIPIV